MLGASVRMFDYGLVITGGIATGKSQLVKTLRQKKFNVIEADAIAHQVLQECLTDIRAEFGEQVIQQGQVNRLALGQLVFVDKAKRQRLEEITHSKIHQQIEQQAEQLETYKKAYFLDIPLYFESAKKYQVKAVAVVYCPTSIALQRLIKRNQLSLAEAQNRIDAQLDIEQKRKQADYVIDNSGSYADFQRQTKLFLDWLAEFFMS